MAQFDRPTQGQELSSTATEGQSGRRLDEPTAARAEPDFSSMIKSDAMRQRAFEILMAPLDDRGENVKALKQAQHRLDEEAQVLSERTPEDVRRAWQALPYDTRQQMIADRRDSLATAVATVERGERPQRDPIVVDERFAPLIGAALMNERASAIMPRAPAPGEDADAGREPARRLLAEARALQDDTSVATTRAWKLLTPHTQDEMIDARRSAWAPEVARVEAGLERTGPQAAFPEPRADAGAQGAVAAVLDRGDARVDARFLPIIQAELLRGRQWGLLDSTRYAELDDPDANASDVAAHNLGTASEALDHRTSVGVRREWDALSQDTRAAMVAQLRGAYASDLDRVAHGRNPVGIDVAFNGDGFAVAARGEQRPHILVDAKFLPLIKAELMEERMKDVGDLLASGAADPFDEHIDHAPRNLAVGARELRYIQTPEGVRREWEELDLDTREAMVEQMRDAYAGDVERVARGLKPVGMYASIDDPGDESTQADWVRRVPTVVERVDALDAKVKRSEVEMGRTPVAPQVPGGVEAAHEAAHSLDAQTERRAAFESDLARQLRGESRDVRNAADDVGRPPAATPPAVASANDHVAGEKPTAPTAGRGAPSAPSNTPAEPQPAAWTGTITEAIRRAQELPGVTAFVSADWERHSRPRVEQADDLVKNIDRVRDLIAPELANMRVYTVTPEGRVHNTVTGRDEYVALSPEVVKARPELERAVEKTHPTPPGRVQELAKSVPSITPDLN